MKVGILGTGSYLPEKILTNEQIEKIANINKNSSSYISFSLKFINEILEKMIKGISYQDSLTELGYFRKYTNIKAYDYLPPLIPNPRRDYPWRGLDCAINGNALCSFLISARWPRLKHHLTAHLIQSAAN